MEKDYKVKVENVTKEYDLFKTQSEKLRSFFSVSKKRVPHFWSLMGISLTIQPGETLGLIGVNGSGKSTLSNIISGIIPQTTGYVDVRGDTSIVAIHAGLRNNLTGRENIRLKSLMQGMTNEQIDEMMPDIIAFADIGDFVDQPVKSYSSGMRSRLGFAIAVHINPDILIIDEALSVGDDTFYQKCVDKITEFKQEGKTIIFVSHSLKQIEMLCDKVAWINYGELKMVGETKTVTNKYREFTKWFKQLSKKEKHAFETERKSIQKNFSIKNYQKQITEEMQSQHPEEKDIHSKIHKLFYGSVISEKMSVWNQLLTWAVLLVVIFFCLVNVSGYSVGHVLSDPSLIMHPSNILRLPGIK
ncbi:MAG: ABC transporter ATP-binding protein [Lentilactobacillus diolivorans]|jgi:teichoic acid transport system ATP-binding protein|uniref:ABC superfamily ATP binding cassette transporter, ABC protein n=2 Tax=Lentilactobacillus diolivorans TaxID=179838 RepID=A0A0R1S6A5_9LACO|nr:ABC transporter ATP-binding protein [Lentilactobacillus diolivorans]KRL64496.1 ABC superfamily ATP binding cassette transporter, ABC protein [Lentilactobacillus diolivorans DSM 14421]MDH5106094.1 ABC transporter ATP-binding protein [Lentilactobacillus diolivorans]RRG00610.1 MAG: ABC transporter ATP-binding protein [Lactobacillus sp.]GEP25176.1 teichoic acids export ATP-binding protein TagH [Lentilactobacillus diolivorans]